MRIAIIGGGFTGLSAAYELTRAGHQVSLFEKESVLGGLAHGWRQPHWLWHLEHAYHHLFTNDRDILSLIDALGAASQVIIKRPVTASLWQNRMYQFDSAMHLLRFPGLPLVDKLRTGGLLALFKALPWWQPLESVSAERLTKLLGGQKAWEVIWEPLMAGKFSNYYHDVPASWLWARIKKRTPRLAYLKGGFNSLISLLAAAIKNQGGTIYTAATVASLRLQKGSWVVTWSTNHEGFDKILLTVPSAIAVKLLPPLPAAYARNLLSISHLHAQILVLETIEPILNDVYWLNITDRSFPFLAAIAHTNFMDKKYYGGHHLTYFGNYLPPDHPYLSLNKDELLQTFLPFIKRLLPGGNSKLSILNSYLFIGPFAQPVHSLRYSQLAPKLETPLPNVYLANMDSIYPWDRGTNYAVALGKTAARKLTE